MVRRGLALACVLVVAAFAAQVASADPSNAKNSQLVTAVCGAKQIQVVVNGNGVFTPAHVVGSTSVFVPTAFDLTFSFTPTGGTTESETDVAAKQNQQLGVVICDIPAALNTFPNPEGTFSISGTVTGFFTPSSN
ncbi:MAG TPA: hypothetical protein VFU10_06600 [Gaiellaceae bacterium]|nr:hypothetical protein [Gaiellaceae bacterium]